MDTTYTIYLRDPAKLRIHRLLKHQPGEWEDDDSRFKGLCDDIKARGVDQPLGITAEGHIVDGRHRWRAAKRHQLALVPCRVYTESEAAAVIVQSLLQRRHYTPGQRAYLLAPTLTDAFTAAAKRMLAGKPVQPSELGSEGPKTLESWAHDIGVSVRYLREAHKVWELFKDDKKRSMTDNEDVTEDNVTLREFYEPRILREEKPYGLGYVVSGAASVLEAERKGTPHKGGRPDDTDNQLRLFNQVTTDEFNRWEYWTKFDDTTKAKHFSELRAKASALPPDRLEEMAEYHTKVAAALRKTAKEAQAATAGKN